MKTSNELALERTTLADEAHESRRDADAPRPRSNDGVGADRDILDLVRFHDRSFQQLAESPPSPPPSAGTGVALVLMGLGVGGLVVATITGGRPRRCRSVFTTTAHSRGPRPPGADRGGRIEGGVKENHGEWDCRRRLGRSSSRKDRNLSSSAIASACRSIRLPMGPSSRSPRTSRSTARSIRPKAARDPTVASSWSQPRRPAERADQQRLGLVHQSRRVGAHRPLDRRPEPGDQRTNLYAAARAERAARQRHRQRHAVCRRSRRRHDADRAVGRRHSPVQHEDRRAGRRDPRRKVRRGSTTSRSPTTGRSTRRRPAIGGQTPDPTTWQVWKITRDGAASIFLQGAPLRSPTASPSTRRATSSSSTSATTKC